MLIKGKKGFTLVELIATIIIIGVLLLIIIPTVSDTLKKSEKNTFTASARGVIRAGTDYFASTGFTYDEGDCISATSDSLNMDKDYQIIGGSVCYIGGQTYLKRVTDGKYCATGDSDSLRIFECDKTVTLTFQVEDAFYDYIDYIYDYYEGEVYNNQKYETMFIMEDALEYDYNYYYDFDYDIADFVIEAEIGTQLGDYISTFSFYGWVESVYNYDYGKISGYNFWDLGDYDYYNPKPKSNEMTEDYKVTKLEIVSPSYGCYEGLVPYRWNKTLDPETIIEEDMTFTVTELGYASWGCAS